MFRYGDDVCGARCEVIDLIQIYYYFFCLGDDPDLMGPEDFQNVSIK